MSASAKLANLVLNDDGFLFDSTTGDSFMANPTAVTILRGLQRGHDEAEIVEDLLECFDVLASDAQEDLTEFVSRLKTLQLA